MKKISSYITKYWYAYVFAIVCMVAAIVLDMIYPKITESLISDVIQGGRLELLNGLLIGIVAVGVGRCVFGYFKEFTFDYVSSKVGAAIRKDLFNHVQTLSMDYFDKTNTGEIMARVKDDVDKVWNVTGYVGMLVLEVVIHVSMVLYCMFTTNWKLTFIPLTVMILCGAVAIVLERKLDGVYEEISEENAKLTTVAEENIAGVRTVKAFAREGFEVNKFLSHNKRYYDLNIRQSKVMIRYYPVFQFVGKMLSIVMAITGGIFVINGEMELGALVAYVEYSRNCIWPVEMVGWLTNDLTSAVASYKKIKKIAVERSSVQEAEEPVQMDNIKGSVTFENVCFSVDNNEILKDISFELENGKTLGIMGATGSGKTSIVNLLQRFFDANSGSVKLDGVDVKSLSLSDVRKSSAVVMQDVFLFSDTIDENIRMGRRKSIDENEIRLAANKARASGFIERMEEKYETVIGERGVGLSGGQKQRISIARALAKNAPILIMDDSTSALDMETEHEIQKMLNDVKSTKIIIAHRISAVRNADEIIYLENGKIAERGTHKELINKKGLYYETYISQYGSATINE